MNYSSKIFNVIVVILSPLMTSYTNTPVVKKGVKTEYKSINSLANDSAAQIIVSNGYQVSLIFPYKIKSVAVNAAIQKNLLTTVDKSDGKVVYLDVLKPGGTGNINIRLDKGKEPTIVKILVKLTKKQSGVLTYVFKDKKTEISAKTTSAKTTPIPAKPIPQIVSWKGTIRKKTINGNFYIMTSNTKITKQSTFMLLDYQIKLKKSDSLNDYLFNSKNAYVNSQGEKYLTEALPIRVAFLRSDKIVSGRIKIGKSALEKEAKALIFPILQRNKKTGTYIKKFIGVSLR